jgi:hypothetical protein
VYICKYPDHRVTLSQTRPQNNLTCQLKHEDSIHDNPLPDKIMSLKRLSPLT